MIRKKSSLIKSLGAILLLLVIYARLDTKQDEVSDEDGGAKIGSDQNRLGRVPQEQEEPSGTGGGSGGGGEEEAGGSVGGRDRGDSRHGREQPPQLRAAGADSSNGKESKVTKSKKEQKPAPNKQDVHTLQTPAGETATLNSKETKKVGESSSGTGKDGPSDEKKTEEGSSNDAASTGERQQSGPDGEKGGDVKKVGVESLAGEREHGIPNVTNRESPVIEGTTDVLDILRDIQDANREQVVLNSDLFGPTSNVSLVIAVQVHNRIEYLRQLIISLSGAKDIHKTLLIFSHDVWDDDINLLVRSIDFCLVLQIYYPFSLQTHPKVFPGESRRDCPRNAKVGEAAAMNCINKDWPDIYGHYREAKFTQTKHHWWWKANQIFHNLGVTRHFNGSVLFLEEDHFVAEDFLQVYKLMETENKKLSPPANILCLGTYLKKFNYKINSKQVELTQWMSSKHNMGMALSRQTWNKIIQCKNHFCQYDDYNWDWSLLYVSLNCLKEKLQVMMVKGPRVFHIGECGVHHKKKDCASSLVMEKVNYIINSAKEYFYPTSLTVSRTNVRKKVKLKKGNGGWGDKRDHQLCLNISSSSATDTF